MTAHLHLQAIGSLKEKRHILKSLMGRLQSRFNVSVAEVEYNDSKLCAVIGVAIAGNDTSHVVSQMEAVVNFMKGDGRFYLGQVERETFGC